MTTDQPGTGSPQSIGHFRVREILGEGGMGTVYVGLDEALDRRVALKVIRAEHRLDPERKARLLREARILSQLDHPGVCQLHDFVEGEDADCLVLELVEGRRLREAMDDGLEHSELLNIIAQLLEVLVAVHGRGVVHRDLKPENVMLTADGCVKVLDFGLAREEKPEGTAPVPNAGRHQQSDLKAGDRQSHDSFTTVGSIVGTVGYMSPEQARGEKATAASDMYSLGLIMQELLTGRCPIRRDLPRAVRLQRAMWGESEPVTGLPPDLATLIERLKELQPAARPAAVDAAAILQRILDRPRRRRLHIAIAAVFALLVSFGVGMTWQYLRAERETRKTEFEAETATQVSEFLLSVFEVSDPSESRGNSVTARELLDRAAERINQELHERPLMQATMMATMGLVYEELGLYTEASSLLEDALELRRAQLPAAHRDLAASLDHLGSLRVAMGQHNAAEPLLREALAMRRRLLGDEHLDVTHSLVSLAELLAIRGDHEAAETLVLEALATLRLILGNEHHEVALCVNNLAFLQLAKGDYDRAESLFREALAMHRRLLGDEHTDVAMCLQNLAAVLKYKGDYDGAEAAFREALAMKRDILGDEHPEVALNLNNLATVLAAKGDYDAAEEHFRESLAIRRRVLGDEHRGVAKTLDNLGLVLKSKGDYAEAERTLREALAMRRRIVGDEHFDVATSLNNIGSLLRVKGDQAGAELHIREAMAVGRKALGDEHPQVARILRNLAGVLEEKGAYDEAVRLYREVLAVNRKSLHPDHPDLISSADSLASLLRKTGSAREAEALELELGSTSTGGD